jgi:tRNA(Ile)-lysidine synthase
LDRRLRIYLVSRNASSPIEKSESESVFATLLSFDHVVLAVSGGPDSMALMVLVAEWLARASSPRPAVSIATVDHRLRAESNDEAKLVAASAHRLGLSHVTLAWDGAKPPTGLPNAARKARYRLLEEHARTLGADRVAIVTAHHRDDQAETFAMRLARGAGIDGLSAMRAERPMRDGGAVMLLRPLLAFPKARLVATLASRGVAYADDPTNRDGRYERARVRSMLSDFEDAGFSSDALATSARRLGDAREALAYAQERFVETLHLSFGNEVFARFDRQAFEHGPAFLRQKILARLIGRFGGASPAPQLSEVEDLVARMQRDGASAATLGGAMISSGSRFVRVWREAGRLDQSEIRLLAGETKVWDQRFLLHRSEVHTSAVTGIVTVKPLGEKGYAAVRSRLAPMRQPPARAALALPSFWDGASLIAAPSLAPFALSDAPPLDPPGYGLDSLATPSGF